MKPKTKAQLLEDIAALQKGCDERGKHIIDIMFAFTGAVGMTRVQHPDSYQVLAKCVTSFFAELKRTTGVDYTHDELTHAFDSFTTLMGFDQVTATVIRETIEPYFEMSKASYEGKSEKEIQELVKKLVERRKKR